MVNRGAVQALDHVWDVNLLEWVPETQPTGGGGGGTVTQGAGGLSPWLVTGPLTDTQLRASAVPISASALPLPTDAATQTTLAQIKAKTDNLDVALSSRTKPADSQHVTVDNASVAVTGTFFQATQPVSGPVTNTELRASAVPVDASGSTVPVSGPLTNGQLRATAVPVDGSGVTQPVSGTVGVSNMIPAVETGLATAAKQDTGNTSLASIDAKLTNPLPVSGTVATGGLTDAQLRATAVPVSGTFYQTTQPVSLATAPSTPVTNTGTFAVQASQATATNLKTQAESYQGGIAVGAANPLQVSLANTGANATAVKVDGSAVTQPVSGSVALAAGSAVIGHVIADTGSTTAVTGNVTVVQGTATNLKVDASGVAVPVTDNGGALTVDNAGTFAVQATVAAATTNIAKAEDVASADADVGVPAMAIRKASPANTSGTDGDYEMLQMSAGRLWTSATIDAALPAGSAVIGHVIADTGSTTAVTGNVTVVQGTATNLKVDASGVAVPVTNANLDVALSTLATAARQDTGNTSLGTIKTNTDPLVTAGAGGYVRQDSTATIAKESGGNLATVKTNTDPLVVAGGGGYVRQDSTATIAKESGGNLATIATNSALAATAARQDTGNTSLASIKTDADTINTNTAPLVVAGGGGYVRQDSTATIAKESGGNLATIATNSGLASTAAKQDTGNASLASIDGKITAVNTGAVVISSSALPSNAAQETGGNLDTLAAVDFALEADGNLATIADNTSEIADTQLVMLACLRELKLLRQSFQDWTGLGEPRYDAEIRIQ